VPIHEDHLAASADLPNRTAAAIDRHHRRDMALPRIATRAGVAKGTWILTGQDLIHVREVHVGADQDRIHLVRGHAHHHYHHETEEEDEEEGVVVVVVEGETVHREEEEEQQQQEGEVGVEQKVGAAEDAGEARATAVTAAILGVVVAVANGEAEAVDGSGRSGLAARIDAATRHNFFYKSRALEGWNGMVCR